MKGVISVGQGRMDDVKLRVAGKISGMGVWEVDPNYM